MDKEGDGENPSGTSWELAKLVGNYERFTQDVDNKLSRIEDKLEDSAETFGMIKTTIAEKTMKINNIENRLENLENNGGLSRRRRWQVDGTAIATVILTVKEIITTFFGGT